MSPTVFRVGAYRFFFFSREELRPHIHVNHPTGEAKFWLDPRIELAVNYGLSAQRLAKALRLIEGVPVISCPHCGESYLAAETLREIERIRLHWRQLSTERKMPVARFRGAA